MGYNSISKQVPSVVTFQEVSRNPVPNVVTHEEILRHPEVTLRREATFGKVILRRVATFGTRVTVLAEIQYRVRK